MDATLLRILPVLLAGFFTACATRSLPPAPGPLHSSVISIRQAASTKTSPETRAALYLQAAREAAALLDSPESAAAARLIYNQAAADLTLLLRSSENGTLWNRPHTFTHGGTTHRLRFAKGNADGHWDPNYFTAFTLAHEEDLKTIKRRNRQDGLGGALVGARKTAPVEQFTLPVGVSAPVTAVLDFQGNDAVLTLIDPSEKTKSRIAGQNRTLEADFSAPLAFYPQGRNTLQGIMGALRVAEHMNITGLYMLQPYDPDRIPLIFVHGLISTPRIWRNVINELEHDPELRKRYQCWVFAYPTGNPPLYSALRLREELDKFQRAHPAAKDAVLVGHSMGGILSRAQVTTIQRKDWDAIGKKEAATLFASVKPGDPLDRGTRFTANPNVSRAIFICTPHRGSEMAIGTLGDLGSRLINLPIDITSSIAQQAGDAIAVATGNPKRLPNSVTGLSPKNPALKVLDHKPIAVPHHSIIGDRGKGNSPQSSDGVVEYWSSQLKSADSEKIVPGPHGSCELPETIDELRRILRLHLSQN